MEIEIVKAAYRSAKGKAEDNIDQTKRYYQGQRDALEWIYLMMLDEETMESRREAVDPDPYGTEQEPNARKETQPEGNEQEPDGTRRDKRESTDNTEEDGGKVDKQVEEDTEGGQMETEHTTEHKCVKCGRTFLSRHKYANICPDCKAKGVQKRVETKGNIRSDSIEATYAKENKAGQEETNSRLSKMAAVQKQTGKSYGQQQAERFLREQ